MSAEYRPEASDDFRLEKGRPYAAAPHTGVDIAASYGTAVRAPRKGRVLLASNSIAGLEHQGTTVIVDHGAGITTQYWHLGPGSSCPGP